MATSRKEITLTSNLTLTAHSGSDPPCQKAANAPVSCDIDCTHVPLSARTLFVIWFSNLLGFTCYGSAVACRDTVTPFYRMSVRFESTQEWWLAAPLLASINLITVGEDSKQGGLDAHTCTRTHKDKCILNKRSFCSTSINPGQCAECEHDCSSVDACWGEKGINFCWGTHLATIDGKTTTSHTATAIKPSKQRKGTAGNKL